MPASGQLSSPLQPAAAAAGSFGHGLRLGRLQICCWVFKAIYAAAVASADDAGNPTPVPAPACTQCRQLFGRPTCQPRISLDHCNSFGLVIDQGHDVNLSGLRGMFHYPRSAVGCFEMLASSSTGSHECPDPATHTT